MPVPTYFKYDLSHLSKSERDTVKILEKVGKIVHKIWLKQVNNSKGTSTFYPSDISKEELIGAAKKNQKLLSAYSVVKRDKARKLYAVPFTEEYKKEHENISILLQQAINVTEDKKLKAYLYNLDKYFKAGEFDKALEAFLKNPNTKIDILMGPIESYNDNFMGIKKSYQFSLRILRDGETHNVTKMTNIVRKLGILRPTGSIAARLKSDQIRFRVDDVYMFAIGPARGIVKSDCVNSPRTTYIPGLTGIICAA